MISFAYWDATPEAPPRQAELVALWHRECLALGLTPRLLTARDAVKYSAYKKAVKRGEAHKISLELWAMGAARAVKMVSLSEYEHRL